MASAVDAAAWRGFLFRAFQSVWREMKSAGKWAVGLERDGKEGNARFMRSVGGHVTEVR